MRVLNRPLGFIVAAALGVASVITIVEVIAVAINAKPVLVSWHVWYRWADRTHWNRPVIKIWSIVLAAVGLIILILELRRSKPRRIRLDSTDAATDAAMTRSGITDTVRAAVLDVDGISKASVLTNRRSVAITASAAGRDRSAAESLVEPVTAAATDRLTSLHLKHDPKIRVRVRPRSN